MSELRRHIMMQATGGGVLKGIEGDGIAYLSLPFITHTNSFEIYFYISNFLRISSYSPSSYKYMYKALFSALFDSSGTSGTNSIFHDSRNSDQSVSVNVWPRYTRNSIIASNKIYKFGPLLNIYDENGVGVMLINVNSSIYANRVLSSAGLVITKIVSGQHILLPSINNSEYGFRDELDDVFYGNIAASGAFIGVYE